MMGNGRLISIILCVGLTAMCMTGCGAAGDGGEPREADRIVEPVTAEDAEETEEEIMVDEKTDSGDVIDTERTGTDNASEEVSFEGSGLSILGDSISTFDGWIPEGCFAFYPIDGAVTDVSQTWWMQLLNETEIEMEICSDDSSSGSTCAGDSLSIDNPQYGCSDYRISLLTGKQGRMPDVIIVYMGTNDFIESVPPGDNDGTRPVEEGVIENFSDAYCLMLDKLASEYPAARIYCCTLLPVGDWGTEKPFVTFTNDLGLTSENYSEQIQVIAKNKGIPVIDLYHCGVEIDNLHVMTIDGVHPTPEGMKCMEQAVLNSMREAPPL